MKEFKEPGKFHTAPLGPPLDSNDLTDNILRVSQGDFPFHFPYGFHISSH